MPNQKNEKFAVFGMQACLGWLACCALRWLGPAWACSACLALAWPSNNNRPPSAVRGGCAAAAAVVVVVVVVVVAVAVVVVLVVFVVVVVAGPGQGKTGKTGPGQTEPRQGTTSKPSQAKPRPES